MSGDHNQYQKNLSYLDFECPRCGHCCYVDADDISQDNVDETVKCRQEPVAWRYALDASVEGPRWIYIDKDPHQWLKGPSLGHALIESLYTSPQQSKPWVGLTADEIWKCNKAKSGSAVEFHICYEHQNLEDFAEAIEAKLKEKNHG